jgi:hypothetical protein
MTDPNRPASPSTGTLYLDAMLQRTIVWDGTYWRDTCFFNSPRIGMPSRRTAYREACFEARHRRGELFLLILVVLDHGKHFIIIDDFPDLL